MKLERLTKAPENAGIDPSTTRVSKWFQESPRENDDPHSPSSTRVCDIFTGVDRASYQVREPIGNDEERLAMKRGDMPPSLPQRVENPRRSRKSVVIKLMILCTTIFTKNYRVSAGTRCRGDKHRSNDDSQG